MFRLNNLQKYTAVLLLAIFLAEILAAPMYAHAQQSTPQSSGSAGGDAVLATIGTLAAGVLAFCIAQAAGEIKIFGFGIGKVFNCAITNPPGVNLLSADGLKNFIFDPVARVIIRTLLQATTQQIVSWIQNDGGKNVGYVKNLEQALRREADLGGGEFLSNLAGINLCGNIGAYLRITLRTPGLRQRLECSVTDIVRNVDSFYRDFQRGGWPAFIRISLEPQNNPYGAYLIALDAKINAEERRKQGFLEPYRAGRTFRGLPVDKEVCTIEAFEEFAEELPEEGQEAPPGGEEAESAEGAGRGYRKVCHTETEYKTPGTLIADGLSKATFGGLDFAVHAKEFDEAISVIINALIKKLITSSFAGSDSGSSGQGIFDPGFNNLPTEDISQSVIGNRINEGVLMADGLLVLADGKLTSDRRDLFAARKRLEELLAASPSGSLPEAEELKKKISALEISISLTLAAKKKVLAIQSEFLLLKRSLAENPSPEEIMKISQKLPELIARLAAAAAELGSPLPSALSTGDKKRDLQASIQNAKLHLAAGIELIDDTVKEIDRVLAGNVDSAKRQDLTAGRAALLAQKTILRGQLDSVTNIEVIVAKTDDPDKILILAKDFTKQLLSINQIIEQTGDILAKVDASFSRK